MRKIEALPEVRTTTGRVRAIITRAPDVVEICIEPVQPVVYLPGQYLQVQFRGYPVRRYTPTVSMNDLAERQFLHLQVQRVRNGRVSDAMGRAIRDGHRVTLQGPFGTAFLRPGASNRLVLVADGAGFGLVWSIAVAAIQERPRRRIVIVVGARTVKSLYMIKALCTLARYPDLTVIPVVETPQNVTPIVRTGRVTDYIPELSAEDTVHACGSPWLVEEVSRMAVAAGARCHGEPFVPQDANESTWSRALEWLNGTKRHPPVAKDVVRRRTPAAPRRRSVAKRSAFAEHAM